MAARKPRRTIQVGDLDIDMTPMIDVVFQLIIFFILMPPREMEGQLESYLPNDGGGKPAEGKPRLAFTLAVKAEPAGEREILSTVLFNNAPVGEFRTYTPEYLDQVYAMPHASRRPILDTVSRQDDEQFNPKDSEVLNRLLSVMATAVSASEDGRNTDILIDAQPGVPFKVVLAILNAGAGARFSRMIFVAPGPQAQGP